MRPLSVLLAVCALALVCVGTASADTPTPTATPVYPVISYSYCNADACLQSSIVPAIDNWSVVSGWHIADYNYESVGADFGEPVHLTSVCWNIWYGADGYSLPDYWYLEASDTGTSDTWVNWTDVHTPYKALGVQCLYPPEGAAASRYWKIATTGTAQWVMIRDLVWSYTPAVPPTATPAPFATPMPQGAMPCISGTVSISPTVQPTPTPYGWMRTPAPTRTPGGPTPTPTSTGAPISSTASYDSGVIKFLSNVEPLEASGEVNNGSTGSYRKFLEWSNTPGQDGLPGVVFAHAGVGNVMTVTESAMPGAITWHKAGGFGSGPVAISFYAKTAYPQHQGDHHFIRVWYLDPNYDANGAAWVTFWEGWSVPYSANDGLEISSNWRHIGYLLTPAGGSGQISALGFTDEAYSESEADPTSYPNFGIYLDDLHVTYGSDANLLHFGACGGNGPGGTNRSGKLCALTSKTTDVYRACHTPATLIDIGSWINWIYCRISTYFKFLDVNRKQLAAMNSSQNEVEPFGSVAEMGGVISVVSGQLDILQQQNRNNGAAPFDPSTMMDLSALDRKPDLHIVTSTSADYLAQCPAELINQNSTAMRGACMSVYLLRTTQAVQLIQLVLNGFTIIMLIYVTLNAIHNLAKN